MKSEELRNRGTKPAWYRSLYWRIALGFVLFLAGMLIVQAAVFLWLVGRSGGPLPGGPGGLARLVSADLSEVLTREPGLDLQEYLQQYGQRGQPVFLFMADGRVFASGSQVPPESLARMAHARLTRQRGGAIGPWIEGDRPRGRRARTGFFGLAPIIAGGRLVGMVGVAPRTPFEQLGPTMAVVAVALLIVGTTLAALVIFGPPRRRLRALEDATRRLGAGDLTARAPEIGGDEVATLARAFNLMASDLASRARQVETSDRARRQLLVDVSHELMTPLTAIRGYLETLAMPELQLEPETRTRYLQIINDETLRLERLIGDLVDLGRLEGGAGPLARQDVLVESLFGRVAARHEREAQSKQIALETTVAPGAEIVVGDPLRLEQALQNLAANALRYTPERGTIELRAEARDGEVSLSVRDTGAGIPPEHLPSIFDRFYKVDGSRQNSSGSGLGLSIVKAIVERHGGTITVSSDPGAGTEFRIQLPTQS